MRTAEWERLRLDILRRGVEVDAARKALKDANREAWPKRHNPQSPAMIIFRAAADRCRHAVHESFPTGFWEDVELLKRRDPAGLRTTLPFLDADPWFFRSGYAKARLVRYLKNVELTHDQAALLREILVQVVESRDREKFEDYCKLARKVDSPSLRLELQRCLESDRLDVKRRAEWMLAILDSKRVEWRLLPGEPTPRQSLR